MTPDPMHFDRPEKVIVVGGGVIGSSIAYELAGRGVSVQLVERGQLGQEASSAAAGMLGADVEAFMDDAFHALCLYSQSMYPDWLRTLEQQTHVMCGYRDSGIVRIAKDEADEQFLRDKARWLQPDGGWQTAEQLRSWLPVLGQSIRGGFYLSRDHQVDPRALTIALTSGMQQRGVKIHEGCEVTELITDAKHRVRGVRFRDGRSVEADHVIIAGGAWSIDLLRPLGLNIPVFPVQGQCYRLRPKQELTDRIIYTKGCYLVPRQDGSVVVGATQREAGYTKHATIEAMHELHQTAIQLLPGLEHAAFLETWSGLRPGTADGWPLLGPVPGYQRLTVAAGHFRNGILLTPVTARLISDIVTGQPPCIDWQPFRAERFAAAAV